MKICRFGNNQFGLVEGTQIRDVSAALDILPSQRYPLPSYDLLVANLDRLKERINAVKDQAPIVQLADAHLLSPVANPGKIIAAPVNYVKHLQEALDDPNIHHDNQVNHIQRAGLFLKAPSSLVGADAGIALRKLDRRNDHEVELAVVIGKQGNNIRREDALRHVAGYCIGLDITIRGPEERSLRKSPDSYTVLGPWLVTADELPDASNLELALKVNNELRQKSNTSDLILGVAELIEFASAFYTLHPGDVIITGTPEGVGPLVPGNVMTASIDRIGSMRVNVRAA
ncbi:fumarylacetoacetate hydrolase family protein [Eoetvoesiella caeni]